MDAALDQFDAQFVQGYFAIGRDALSDPVAMGGQLAARPMTLPRRRKRARRSMQDHHVVDKPGRHSKMPGGLTVSVTFFHKRNDTRTQLDRMRLAHGGSPSMAQVNHKLSAREILNLKKRDLL